MNTLPDARDQDRQERRDESLVAYRACAALMKSLRRELGIIKCPFCPEKEGNGHSHMEPREPYAVAR